MPQELHKGEKEKGKGKRKKKDVPDLASPFDCTI